MTDVRAFLASLGLERYADAFVANDVDIETLPQLTGDDLRELGVSSIGHRRRLLDAVAARVGRPSPRAPAAAERRQVTVLFADLVGATQLSTELDPEDLRAIYQGYQTVCAEAVERFDGHVAQLLGDGVVAYFGYPHAHEDVAERAARAGLELVARVSALPTPGRTALSSRVGIATGVVVVGDVVATHLGEERPVVGETPNLAARLQSMAPPGGVVLGDRTRRLLRGALELADLGVHELKGFRYPVHAWQVLGDPVRGSRASTTPLVDRSHELATLRSAWRLAKNREGSAITLVGAPGIGKSRLLGALVDEVRADAGAVVSCFCSPLHVTSSLHPVRILLERTAGITSADDRERRRVKLTAVLGSTDAVEALGPLVGVEPAMLLSPQRLKERMLGAALDTLEALAERSPVLLVVENIQWLDPTTAELLERTCDWCTTRSVLVVLTLRPGAEVGWLRGLTVSSVALEPLTREDCLALVALHSDEGLPDRARETIVDNADGVPLFLEELTKNVVERRADGEEVSSLRVPETLEDSLLERLDRLGDGRALAQVAAVIGRELTHGFLVEVSGLEPSAVDEQIGSLLRAGLLVQEPGPGDTRYRFSHALVQQAAYGTLLRERRLALHARVVEALERSEVETLERTPELLGRHCAAAGLTEKAVDYWRAAGDRAMAQSADAEAIASYREALAQLALLPQDDVTRRREIELQTALGVPLLSIHGVAAPEPEAVYARAREIATEIGAARELFPALWGLAVVYSGRGEMQRAAELAEELRTIARREADPELVLEAHHAAWVYDFFLGRLDASAEHVAAGSAVAEGLVLDTHALLYGGHDPGLCARNFGALHAWLGGRSTRLHVSATRPSSSPWRRSISTPVRTASPGVRSRISSAVASRS
ncbi:MAG: AAA family ATPase [Actinobacteria bacterium]|nr:AAA family ATPase [Actinomycetota bacterium]